VIGIVFAAIFFAFHESIKFMAGQKDLRRAVLLGGELVNEIRAKDFAGVAAGGIASRADCVGVEDYHLWFESPPQTIDGQPMSNLSGFARSVIVERINTNNFNFNGAAVTNDTDFRRITVVVGAPQFSVSNVAVVGRYDLAK
jgi:hypothetical protein